MDPRRSRMMQVIEQEYGMPIGQVLERLHDRLGTWQSVADKLDVGRSTIYSWRVALGMDIAPHKKRPKDERIAIVSRAVEIVENEKMPVRQAWTVVAAETGLSFDEVRGIYEWVIKRREHRRPKGVKQKNVTPELEERIGHHVRALERAEYTEQRNQIMLVAAMIEGLEINDVLDKMRWAESMGAFLDPTAYRAKGHLLRQEMKVAEALRECQRKIQAVREDAERGR